MSYFICMTVPAGRNDLASCFHEKIAFWQVTNAALGETLLKNQGEGEAYLVTLGQVSDDLLGKGRSKEDCLQWFIEGITRASEQFPYLTLVLIWAQGQGTLKHLPIKDEKALNVGAFCSLHPNLEQNVRYVISRTSP